MFIATAEGALVLVHPSEIVKVCSCLPFADVVHCLAFVKRRREEDGDNAFCGPVSAMMVWFDRLGWPSINGEHLIDDLGREIHLKYGSARDLAALFGESLGRAPLPKALRGIFPELDV